MHDVNVINMNMMMSCPCHVNAKQNHDDVMPTWCPDNVNTNDICHAMSVIHGMNGL